MSTEFKEHKMFITGHRPDRLWGYNIQDERYMNLKKRIKEILIEKQCTELFDGMALGVDTIAAMAALELRDLGYNIKLHACIPCAGQDKLWNISDRVRYQELLERADEVEYVSKQEYSPQLMKERNHFMVDECVEGLAVINSDMSLSKTGTQECINYAEKNESDNYEYCRSSSNGSCCNSLFCSCIYAVSRKRIFI